MQLDIKLLQADSQTQIAKAELQGAFACPPIQSLVKSSWESRDQPTIIPQGVPYMVKLLRYYVSEDAVYLHLEHLQGKARHRSVTATWGALLNFLN